MRIKNKDEMDDMEIPKFVTISGTAVRTDAIILVEPVDNFSKTLAFFKIQTTSKEFQIQFESFTNASQARNKFINLINGGSLLGIKSGFLKEVEIKPEGDHSFFKISLRN